MHIYIYVQDSDQKELLKLYKTFDLRHSKK